MQGLGCRVKGVGLRRHVDFLVFFLGFCRGFGGLGVCRVFGALVWRVSGVSGVFGGFWGIGVGFRGSLVLGIWGSRFSCLGRMALCRIFRVRVGFVVEGLGFEFYVRY